MNEAAKRAAELANAVRPESFVPYTEKEMEEWRGVTRAFVKYIQHVSNVAERVEAAIPPLPNLTAELHDALAELRALILPKPKPDPLVEALIWCNEPFADVVKQASVIRAELAKRGGRIVFEDD